MAHRRPCGANELLSLFTGQIWQFGIPQRWTDKVTNAIINQMIGWCIEQYVKANEYPECYAKICGECGVIGPKRLADIWLVVHVKFAVAVEIIQKKKEKM